MAKPNRIEGVRHEALHSEAAAHVRDLSRIAEQEVDYGWRHFAFLLNKQYEIAGKLAPRGSARALESISDWLVVFQIFIYSFLSYW